MPEIFGELPGGRPVHRLVLGSEPGVELHLLTLGSTIHRLRVTGGDGQRRDVALGYADVGSYLEGTYYLGAVVGRYANRVAHGRAVVGGSEVELGTNDRGHHLHGGPDGFDQRLWEVVDAGPDHAHLRLVSPDGDQGFPGEVTVDAHWSVSGDEVRLDLEATTDAETLVNLSSHLYLNLEGDGLEGATTIDDHVLAVPAATYLPVDDTGIPLGDPEPVEGTPFDLRAGRRLGDVARTAHPQTAAAQGVDHDLVVDGQGLRTVATLTSPATRTRMTLTSDQPGLQVYAGDFLDGSSPSRTGRLLRQGDGVALEPQLHPDSPHHPDWPSAVLRPGETYRSQIRWSFSATS